MTIKITIPPPKTTTTTTKRNNKLGENICFKILTNSLSYFENFDCKKVKERKENERKRN